MTTDERVKAWLDDDYDCYYSKSNCVVTAQLMKDLLFERDSHWRSCQALKVTIDELRSAMIDNGNEAELYREALHRIATPPKFMHYDEVYLYGEAVAIAREVLKKGDSHENS